MKERSIENPGSLPFYLYKGIVENWREFTFYQKTRINILQPTYISFFGFLNIQKYGKPCTMKEREMWYQFYDILGEKNVFKDSHHFDNPNNFCTDSGKIVFLDYGGKNTQALIKEFG